MIAGGLILSAALVFADPSPVLSQSSESTESSSSSSASEPPASSESSQTPPKVISPERQEILNEMRARKVLPPAADDYTHDDKALLDHVRRAEAAGAIDLLKGQIGAVQGYAVMHRVGSYRSLWLTKAGYEKYIFVRSQQALKYFEDQGTEPKFLFRIKGVKGESLFDDKGLLTPAGDDLYNRILSGQTVRWLDASGQITDNAPLQPENK